MTAISDASDTPIVPGCDNLSEQNAAGRRVLEKQRALDRFLASVEKRAFRIAQIATSHSDDAFDIVQDAMFKLVEKYADRDEAQWQALFHRILQSRIRDWYRRNTVRNRFRCWLGGNAGDEQDPMQGVADEAGRSPETELENAQSMDALDRALGNLPVRQQQAFILRVWEGLDVRETAKAMACSEGSVKTHFSRAVHSLRDALGEHWHE